MRDFKPVEILVGESVKQEPVSMGDLVSPGLKSGISFLKVGEDVKRLVRLFH